jgi:hypothetical protein
MEDTQTLDVRLETIDLRPETIDLRCVRPSLLFDRYRIKHLHSVVHGVARECVD